ncbi:MAG TPA: glycosyltransferase [Acetobacteraceae bacterium]|nr:glycosyltransferase [Acetobacteraceae bacterium]
MTVRLLAGSAGPPHDAYDADIVILALDRAVDTAAAITSALAQGGVARHLWVVDQGSQPPALKHLVGLIGGRGDATLVSLGTNRGVAGGRNTGAALGHGRVIVGLDNDAEFADCSTLARAVAALDATPDVGALGFRIVEHAGGRDDLASWGYPRKLLTCSAAVFDAVTFVGAGHAIRRSAWQAAGGYDERLFFCWEEYDFCLRAIECGWRVQYRGDLVVRHKLSAERRVGWSGERWGRFVRNRLYIERKWGASWLVLVPRIGGYVAKGLCNRQLGSTVRAIRDATRLSCAVEPGRLSHAARDYVMRNDRAHRGGWLHRLRREVLSPLVVADGARDGHSPVLDSRSPGSLRDPTSPAPRYGIHTPLPPTRHLLPLRAPKRGRRGS